MRSPLAAGKRTSIVVAVWPAIGAVTSSPAPSTIAKPRAPLSVRNVTVTSPAV